MADSKLTALAEDTSPSADDILYSVNDPGGTPTSKKVTLSNLLKFVHGLTENTTPATTDEVALIDDPSSSPAPQRISLVNLLKVINGLTEDTTPDTANDFILSYDASASTVKKVKMENAAPTPVTVDYDYLSTLVNTEVSITGTDTANWGYQHVVTGSTDFTITLEACNGHAAEFMSFRILNTGVTTLDGNSAETIDGVANKRHFQGQTVWLYCDGTNAHTIGQIAAPRAATVFSDVMIHSKSQSIIFNAGQKFGYYSYQTSPANGDTYEFSAWLNKGACTLSILGATLNSTGILDWTMNGVSIATGQDWYSASTVYTARKTISITIPYTGYHKFVATVNGKNASSSNYYYAITCVDFYPAAY